MNLQRISTPELCLPAEPSLPTVKEAIQLALGIVLTNGRFVA